MRAASRSDFVLAGSDGGEGGIAAELKFGKFDVGFGAELGVLGFLVGGEGIGFGLDDLLFGFGEIGFGFVELELLLGGIELDDDVAGVDELAGIAERGDGHICAGDHGGDEHFGIAALELAAGGNGDVTRPRLTRVVGISRAAVAVVARMRRRAPQASPPTTART